MNQIDPIEFGRVLARLDQQDQQSAEMRTEISQMRTEIQSLLALANRGKGALFTLTSIGAAVGAVLGALGHHFWGK
jgi:type II secretory pathway component PulJ